MGAIFAGLVVVGRVLNLVLVDTGRRRVVVFELLDLVVGFTWPTVVMLIATELLVGATLVKTLRVLFVAVVVVIFSFSVTLAGAREVVLSLLAEVRVEPEVLGRLAVEFSAGWLTISSLMEVFLGQLMIIREEFGLMVGNWLKLSGR